MDQAKILEIISLLARLPGSSGNAGERLNQLKSGVEKGLEMFKSHPDFYNQMKGSVQSVTQKFIRTSLHALKFLAKFCSDESSSNLLSIQQQQKIKVLLQMIFSLGIVPSLLKGVNTPLRNKTYQLFLLNLEESPLIESYRLMGEIVRCLVYVLRVPSLRALVITHLGDLMSAMLQVGHAGPLKKPVKVSPGPWESETATPPSQSSPASSAKTFVMTEEMYEELMKDRAELKEMYQKVVNDVYKPLVIKELLILLAPTKSLDSGQVLPPPPWLKKAISNQLTGYLIGPGGVSLVMRAVCESGSDEVDWSKAEVLAKLISTVQGSLSDEEFYSKIGPQVISLLNMTGSHCVPVAKSCIRRIHEQNARIANKYIFDKLFEVFVTCSKAPTENFTGTLVSEDSLSRCIDQLTKCFGPGSKDASIPIGVLIKVIKIMYKLYMKVSKSAYQHKAAIQDLLIEFLHSEKDQKKLRLIYDALIFEEGHEDMLEMNGNLEFQFGPTGGVQVGRRLADDPVRAAPFPPAEIQLELETAGDDMLDLLSSDRLGRSKALLSDFFVVLLSSLSDYHDSKIELTQKANPDIMTVDELIVFLVRISQKRIITIKLLAVLAENALVAETIQEKPEMAFGFVKTLLESKAKDLLLGKKPYGTSSSSIAEEEGDEEDAEDLVVALAVVDLMTLNLKSNSDRWDTCKCFVDSIEVINANCGDSTVKYYSDLLLNRIKTHGAVSGGKKPQIRSFPPGKSFRLDSTSTLKDTAKTSKRKPENNRKLVVELNDKGKEKTELDVAMEDIRSPDVPTRGHAIIQLAKLIRKKDEEALKKVEYVFSALICNLKHEDTYIYLSAINALEAIGNVWKGEKVLEILCKEYTENKKDSTEMQAKIGEVLMRITRGMGETAPRHKALLINTFLFGAKNSDEFLRISSLSNLAELLRTLGYGVGPIIQEVFACVKAIATTDKSVMARRAAVMVIQFLLKGLSGDSFMVLEFVIRDLYRALLHIYKTDKDDVMRLHAELALGEINRLVKPSLEEPKKLEKHIGILSLPR